VADLLEWASGWLEDQRVKHASRPVIYRQDAQSAEVQATVGRTVFELDNGYGVLEKVESRDYLILAADLILGAVAVLPKRGDQIRETQGTITYVYEVMAPGKEPHWRYSDPFRKTLRIHTKHVGTE